MTMRTHTEEELIDCKYRICVCVWLRIKQKRKMRLWFLPKVTGRSRATPGQTWVLTNVFYGIKMIKMKMKWHRGELVAVRWKGRKPVTTSQPPIHPIPLYYQHSLGYRPYQLQQPLPDTPWPGASRHTRTCHNLALAGTLGPVLTWHLQTRNYP